MSDEEKKDRKDNVVEMAGAAAALETKKSKKKKTAKRPRPPEGEEEKFLSAADIYEILLPFIFEEDGLNWTLNPITGLFRTKRAQQDGPLTMVEAAKDILHARRGHYPFLSEAEIAGGLKDIVSDKRAAVWLVAKKRHGKPMPKDVTEPDNLFIEEFLRAILAEDVVADPKRFRNCVAVVRHWIRNVKRRLMGLPDTNHFILAFHGPGGSGKSTYIQDFCLSFDPYLAGLTSLTAYNPKTFGKDHLAQWLVGFADEANGEDGVSVSDLKNGITSPVVLGRNMYSPQSPQPDRNMNLAISRNGLGIWPKLAGDRRPYNMLCTHLLYQQNSAAIDAAKELFPLVWDSVYYDEPEWIKDVLVDIRKEQEFAAANEGFVDRWLAVCCEPPEAPVATPWRIVQASMYKFAKSQNTKSTQIPVQKDDLRDALRQAGAVMTTTGNKYPLVSHRIKPEYMP